MRRLRNIRRLENAEEYPRDVQKEYPFLKEVDSLALANVQLHLEWAYRNFLGIRLPVSEIQVKTQKQKQLYNKYGKRKHSGGRAAAEASEAEMDRMKKHRRSRNTAA